MASTTSSRTPGAMAERHVARIRTASPTSQSWSTRERTEAEFRNLLGGAGFTVHRVVRTGSSGGLGIIEAVAGSTAAKTDSLACRP